MYLPTYCPDINPIARWWANLKQHLLGLGPRALDELARAVRRLRAATLIAKLSTWFRRCLCFPPLDWGVRQRFSLSRWAMCAAG